MKNLSFLIMLLMLAARITYGQGNITGIVEQETTKEAVEFASVRLMNAADSMLVQGALTDEKGTFYFKKIKTGEYFITVEHLGYSDFSTAIFTLKNNETQALETIRLIEAVAEADEVEIVADKPPFEQQIDKMVINVATSPTFAGLSALDILGRSPSVQIDQMNNIINLAGRGAVQIYINGKQSRMPTDAVIAMLRGTAGSSIEKIEVYAVPPARFDAEGSGGIINIIMRQNPEEGFNGNYSLSIGYGYREKLGGSVNANLRKGKMNLFGSYSADHDRSRQFFENRRTIRLDGNTTTTKMLSERFPIERANNARLGLDLNLSDKTTVGVLVSGYDTWWDMDAVNSLSLRINDALKDSLSIPNREINHWQHIMGNINLDQKIGKAGKLNIDLDYLHFFDNNPTDYQNQYFDNRQELIDEDELRSSKKTPIDIFVGKADYSVEVSEKVNFALGAKITRSSFTNALGVENLVNGEWLVNQEFTNTYELDERINAGYVTADFGLGKKIQIKLGLRYEQTLMDIFDFANNDTINRNFGQFFPTVFTSYDLGNEQKIQLSYARRINRPTFNDLAPFYLFWDPFTLFTGNPNLLPSTSNELRLNYNIKQVFISIGAGLDFNNIAGFQPRVNPETNQQFFGPTNIDRAEALGVSISFPLKVGKVLQIRTNVDVVNRTIVDDYEGISQRISQLAASIFQQHQFKLPKDWTFELSGNVYTPWQFGVNRSRTWASINAGIQKRFKNESRLSLNINDIFWTARWRWNSIEPDANLDVFSGWSMEPRIVRLSYTHRFGRKTVKGARDRQTGSAEEQGRVN